MIDAEKLHKIALALKSIMDGEKEDSTPEDEAATDDEQEDMAEGESDDGEEEMSCGGGMMKGKLHQALMRMKAKK